MTRIIQGVFKGDRLHVVEVDRRFYFGPHGDEARAAAIHARGALETSAPASSLAVHVAKYRALRDDLGRDEVAAIVVDLLGRRLRRRRTRSTCPTCEGVRVFERVERGEAVHDVAERVARALEVDPHLNSIGLATWDSAHDDVVRLVRAANGRRRDVFGADVRRLAWALSDTVSLLKRAALDEHAAPGAEAAARGLDAHDAVVARLTYNPEAN